MRQVLFLATALGVFGCAEAVFVPVIPELVPPGGTPVLRPIVAVSPGVAVAMTFTTPDIPLTWMVNGVTGGNASLGSVNAAGQYTAPASPPGDSVVITMFRPARPDSVQRSVVFFVPSGGTQNHIRMLPRVVDLANTTPMRLLVTNGSAASVVFAPTAGASITLDAIGGGMFTGVIPTSALVAGHREGSLHKFVGFLDEYDTGGTRLRRLNLVVNIRDSSHPDVAITALGDQAQRSPSILNLRYDTLTVNATPALVARAVAALGSTDFDFITIIASVNTTNNRNYQAIRNDIAGIGLGSFDNSAVWGSGPRALGAISYPIDAFFDGAEKGMLHEIGHRWVNFSTVAPLLAGRPHWPMSSMASGIMGFTIPTGAGGDFPFGLTDLGDGTVRVSRLAGPRLVFDPFDLYLMGLLPPDSVPTGLVLPTSTSFSSLTDAAVLPASRYTIADYVAQHGERVPSHAASPREYRMVSVILSPFRLLTPSEMAFFDAAAARGETEVALPAQIGFSVQDAPGMFQATGGRARLQTRLP